MCAHPRRRLFLDDDAGLTVADYVDAPAYGGAAAMGVEDLDSSHEATCECDLCVFA